MKLFQYEFAKIALVVCCLFGVNVHAATFAPQVSISPTGPGVAVWARAVGGNNQVEAASINALGMWSSPPVVLSPGAQKNSYPIVETDALGNAVAIWTAFDSLLNIRILMTSSYSVSLDTWSAAAAISDPMTDNVLLLTSNLVDAAYKLDVEPSGDAVAIWNSKVSGVTVIRAARLTAGVWDPPVTVAP